MVLTNLNLINGYFTFVKLNQNFMETNNVIFIRMNRNNSNNKLNKIRKREQTDIYIGSSLEDRLQGVHPLVQNFKYTLTKSPPRFLQDSQA